MEPSKRQHSLDEHGGMRNYSMQTSVSARVYCKHLSKFCSFVDGFGA